MRLIGIWEVKNTAIVWISAFPSKLIHALSFRLQFDTVKTIVMWTSTIKASKMPKILQFHWLILLLMHLQLSEKCLVSNMGCLEVSEQKRWQSSGWISIKWDHWSSMLSWRQRVDLTEFVIKTAKFDSSENSHAALCIVFFLPDPQTIQCTNSHCQQFKHLIIVFFSFVWFQCWNFWILIAQIAFHNCKLQTGRATKAGEQKK